MIRLIKYLKPYSGLILLSVLLLFIQAASELALPGYMSDIVNRGIATADTSYIIKTGVLMIAVTLLSVVCSTAVGLLASKTAAGSCKDLRSDLFKKVQLFSNAEFDQFSASSLITRTTNDITQIQQLLIMMIRMVFYAPILAVGGFLHALAKSSSMSWIIGVAVVMLLCIVFTVFSLAIPKFKRIQTIIDRVNAVVRENLEGMLVIRAFNTQRFEEARFDEVNKELTAVSLFVHRVMSGMMPAMMLLMNLVTVAVVWVGASQVADFRLDVGDMMAYMQYVMQIIMAFLMMSMMFIQIPRASISAGRIADVLKTEPSITDVAESTVPMPRLRGEVCFDKVTFSYPGASEPVLREISFTASPGQTTALIGSTGSGKSTIVNLIPRFYDITEGEIRIDGMDIKKMSLHDLRENLGYVPQRGMLFSGTIRSNLTYADANASEEEIRKAAEIAQAMEFIEAKPEGFASAIAQGGSNVSGGQKQRLAIARALLKNPQIYIFDDSFSALDYKTDANLRAALKEKTKSSTVLLIAQRISTIRDAEQILVLEQGRIVSRGTHKELLKQCEVYQEIAASQLSEEELR
ncbi:MAG: ABC transporter ATP-binding protein [Eubacteriales bacterium]|nr:ABC transporter ATP-binding protein [Eubacteriales bacterium]MDD3350233.1 ABC transporter ATP-binding protein [Eubacteriales bacterium]